VENRERTPTTGEERDIELENSEANNVQKRVGALGGGPTHLQKGTKEHF